VQVLNCELVFPTEEHRVRRRTTPLLKQSIPFCRYLPYRVLTLL
jgi:hypothetical protein